MRIVIRHRDARISTGYVQAFDPGDGSVMVMVAPKSPAGTMVSLEIVEILVLEPTDGRPLPPPSAKHTQPSPGVHIVFGDEEVLVGCEGSISPGVGVWMRPPNDRFARAFVPEGAARHIELLEAEPTDPPQEMWAFISDATPTDEVELPDESITRETSVNTGPTDMMLAINPDAPGSGS